MLLLPEAPGLSTETTMTNETLSPEGNATVSSSPENNPAPDVVDSQ